MIYRFLVVLVFGGMIGSCTQASSSDDDDYVWGEQRFERGNKEKSKTWINTLVNDLYEEQELRKLVLLMHPHSCTFHESNIERLIAYVREHSVTVYGNAIRVAAENKCDSVLPRLLEGRDVNELDENEFTHLTLVVEAKNTTAANILIDAGANVNLPGKGGLTPLMKAARCGGSLELTQLLLLNKANVNAQTESGNTALLYAIGEGSCDIEVVNTLIAAGADVNVKNKEGKNPLWRVRQFYGNNSEMEKILREAGAVDLVETEVEEVVQPRVEEVIERKPIVALLDQNAPFFSFLPISVAAGLFGLALLAATATYIWKQNSLRGSV